MPKDSHRGKSKKGKKKYRARRLVSPVSRRITTLEGASPPPVTQTQSAAVGYPYLRSDLKRIGIIAGIMLVILIVLSLVL
jgi:hypothetical protein